MEPAPIAQRALVSEPLRPRLLPRLMLILMAAKACRRCAPPMVEAMEGAKASALSPVMDEPEAPAEAQPRRRNARARLFVLLEAGVQPDDTKVFDRGRHTHTHTHRLAS
jgi:hypothetical protein